MENDNTNWVIIGAIASVICAVVGILSLFDVNLKSAKSSETKEVVQKTSGPEYTKRADDNSSKNSNQISVEAVDLGLSVRWADKRRFFSRRIW